MDPNLEPIRPLRYADGSRVLGSDGLTIGEVVASYREHLIVERGYFFPTNIYIPFTAIAEAGGGDIVLSLGRRDALRQGWEQLPADPIAPPAAILPAPPPDPTFPSQTGMEQSRPPAPEAQPVKEVAAVDQVGVPEPLPATPEPPADPAAAASDQPESTALTDEPVALESIQEVPSTDQQGEPADGDPSETPSAAPPDEPDVRGIHAESAAVSEDAVVAEDQPKPDDLPVPTAPAEAPAPVAAPAAPPFVGIPGRRLTDSELWSLLEPKEGAPAESGEPEEAAEDSAAAKPEPKE